MIYIVIPCFNRREMTRKNMECLRQQTNQNFKVIVVDDGSTDGTSEMLESDFPEVIVLKGDGNLWWTGAINVGIRHALELCDETDYIMVQNDDLTVADDYIETFYRLGAEHPDTLIQSVELIPTKDGRHKVNSGGNKVNWLTAKGYDLNKGKYISEFERGYFVESSTLTGRGVLIPSEVFRKIGIYNDRHYAQCGDTEFPRRAYKAGYKLIVTYDNPVYSYALTETHINHIKRYKFSVKGFKKYFFNIRSNANLRYRFWFAYDSATNPIKGTIYFFFDMLRVSYHYFSRLSL